MGRRQNRAIVTRPVIVTSVTPAADDLFAVELRGVEGMSVSMMIRATEADAWIDHRNRKTELEVRIFSASRKAWG